MADAQRFSAGLAESMKSLHLIYHEIRSTPSSYSYVVSCSDFEDHCHLFSALQSAGETPEWLRPELTFDDGHISAVDHALPMLKAHGLAARFFITAGWTGTKAGYMNSADLRTLKTSGMGIGAHGWSHKLLTHCTAAELNQELVVAKAKLEDVLGTPVTSISLPGGRCNARVLRACYAAGYGEVFTSSPTVRSGLQTSTTIGRLNIRGDISVAWLERVLNLDSGVLVKLQRSDRLKSTAKAILGDRLYAGVWKIANRQETDPADAGAHAL